MITDDLYCQILSQFILRRVSNNSQILAEFTLSEAEGLASNIDENNCLTMFDYV